MLPTKLSSNNHTAVVVKNFKAHAQRAFTLPLPHVAPMTSGAFLPWVVLSCNAMLACGVQSWRRVAVQPQFWLLAWTWLPIIRKSVRLDLLFDDSPRIPNTW